MTEQFSKTLAEKIEYLDLLEMLEAQGRHWVYLPDSGNSKVVEPTRLDEFVIADDHSVPSISRNYKMIDETTRIFWQWIEYTIYQLYFQNSLNRNSGYGKINTSVDFKTKF